MSGPDDKSTPQFGTAEYKQQPGGDVCMTCGQAITEPYYRVSGAMTCRNCAQQVAGNLPKDSHTAFARAALFGIGGAVLGLILYSTVGIVTGYSIGYISLAVGYIVGRAIMMGSSGIGGRRYQILALLLTYGAVSLSAVPIAISQMGDEKTESTTTPSADPADPAKPADAAGKNAFDKTEDSDFSLGALLIFFLMLGLASPFLELSGGFGGIIGLVILFVGLQIAWSTTTGSSVDVRGPYPLTQ
jgi:hypothetical protein